MIERLRRSLMTDSVYSPCENNMCQIGSHGIGGLENDGAGLVCDLHSAHNREDLTDGILLGQPEFRDGGGRCEPESGMRACRRSPSWEVCPDPLPGWRRG